MFTEKVMVLFTLIVVGETLKFDKLGFVLSTVMFIESVAMLPTVSFA